MTPTPSPDVVVVGGGAAGLSAALVLGRARASVVLVDDDHPSNAPSTGVGGLLGHDGVPPAELYRRAGDELARYPTVARRRATVRSIEPGGSRRWHVELDGGTVLAADRVLLATGMHYARPELDGLEERWGASVFHCPFCHGWEHRDQPLVVLGGPMAVERALLLRRWAADLALVTQGVELGPAERAQLAGAGVRVVEGEVVSLHGPGRELEWATLADGSRLAARGLLVGAPHQPRQPALLAGLGLATTPTGHVAVDGFGATSAPGVWAAGDLTGPLANVARAIAEGSLAAVAITKDLVAAEHGLVAA